MISSNTWSRPPPSRASGRCTWCRGRASARGSRRRGDRAVAGKVTDATFLHEALKGGRGPVVVAAPAGQLARVIAAVKEAVPDAPLLVLRDDDRHGVQRDGGAAVGLRRAHRPARARARHAAGPRRAAARPLLRRRARADPHAGRSRIPTPSPPRWRSRPSSAAPAPPRPCAPSAPSRGPRTWRCARSSRSRWRRSTRRRSISSTAWPWWTCSPRSWRRRSTSARWTW